MFKKIKAAGIVFLMMIMTLTLFGCGVSGQGSQGPSGEVTDLDGDLMEGIKAENPVSEEDMEKILAGEGGDYLAKFAAGLMKAAIKDEKGNLLISPISVLYALSMTANGAEGMTKEELLTALTEGKYSGEVVCGTSSTGEGDIYDEMRGNLNEYLGAYLKYIEAKAEREKERLGYMYEEGEAPEPSQLDIANSIWLKDDEDLTVEKDFLETNGKYYDAGVFKREFDEGARQDLNAWIEEHTGGTIKDMVKEMPDNAVMFLVNALAFQAFWADPFMDYQLKQDVFHGESGDKDGITFMRGNDRTYLEDEKATGFIKYYQGYSYAFVGLLPKDGVTVDEYIDGMDGGDLRNMLKSGGGKEVNYTMPKFKEESGLSLVDTFKKMGVVTAFDSENADFSRLGKSEEGNLYIGNILHNTFIDVNEEGTKAGAATVVEIATESAFLEEEPPKEVVLDKPFIYMLVDVDQGLPLFMGVIRDL